MTDAHDARINLGNWFVTMLDELDEDKVDNVNAITDLQGRIAKAFAELRLAHGIGSTGPGT